MKNIRNSLTISLTFWAITLILLGLPVQPLLLKFCHSVMLGLCAAYFEFTSEKRSAKLLLEGAIDVVVAHVVLIISERLVTIEAVAKALSKFSIPHANLLIAFIIVAIVSKLEVTPKK